MALRKLFNPLSIVLVLLIAAVVYFNFMHQVEVEEEEPQRAVPVEVTKVSSAPFRDVIEALGTARANESVVITAQSQDIVQAVHFEDGDRVEAGQLLIELDSREELARVQELKFRLAEASRQYERLLDLTRQNVASQQQLEAQDVIVKEIIAELEVAETQLAQKRITAPFSGNLGIRQVSVGALVSPGQQITTLDDITPIRINFNVPELFLASLALGQTVNAQSGAYPDREFTGKIDAIDSRVDPVTRSITVRANIPNQDGRLRPGMLMRIQLLRSVNEAIILPEKAIVPIQDRHFVYVVGTDQKVTEREVEVGRRKLGKVEILGGLEIGERVVTDGIVRVRDGITVTVRKD